MARMTWRTTEEIEQAAHARALANLRAERDRRLRESDWTQIGDSPLAAAAKGEWQQYRRALRDLPQSTTDPRNPAWPAPPA